MFHKRINLPGVIDPVINKITLTNEVEVKVFEIKKVDVANEENQVFSNDVVLMVKVDIIYLLVDNNFVIMNIIFIVNICGKIYVVN